MNYYSELSDQVLLDLVYAMSEKHPVYEPCTEEEYNAADEWERFLGYKVEPIYNTGIMGIINGAEPVGYRYKRIVPGEWIFVVFDGELLNELRKRKLINNKGETINGTTR
jgi:hypothetical protein